MFVRNGNQNVTIITEEKDVAANLVKKFRSAETIRDCEEFITAVRLSWFPAPKTSENDEFLVNL